MLDGRTIQINLATPKFSKVEQLSANLARAELRLAKARLEVQRIREELSQKPQ